MKINNKFNGLLLFFLILNSYALCVNSFVNEKEIIREKEVCWKRPENSFKLIEKIPLIQQTFTPCENYLINFEVFGCLDENFQKDNQKSEISTMNHENNGKKRKK